MPNLFGAQKLTINHWLKLMTRQILEHSLFTAPIETPIYNDTMPMMLSQYTANISG
ncbi:MAG: hypothetical protein RUDDFDWM_000077 [Candidatus Fervidibacterota bacterium]